MARTGGFAMGGAYVGADNWHDRIKQRDRQIVAEVEDAATKAEASKREREEKEKAEIAAAKERDRQAYRERGWPA
jgi:hypothetical protein